MSAARPRAWAKASAMRCGPSIGGPKPTVRARAYARLRGMGELDTHTERRRRARGAPSPARRRALLWFAGTAALIVVVYLLVPRLAGLQDTWRRIDNGSPAWLGVAIALEAVSY